MYNRSKTSKTSSGVGSDAKEKRRKASENNNKNVIQYILRYVPCRTIFCIFQGEKYTLAG